MRNFLFAWLVIVYLGYAVGAPKSLILTSPITPIPQWPKPPQQYPSPNYNLLNLTVGSNPNIGKEDNELAHEQSPEPIIYQFDINSNISNRYARTLVKSKVKNSEIKAKEATFTVVLPEKAFISEFVMEVDGKSYKAYVKEKEEAKQIYNKAVQSGQSAGHVAVSARDSNRFTVSVNVEPEKKATFLLTYEELLERKNNQYELVLNIHPGQIVKDMNIEVFVNESRPLKFVRTPSLRSGNEISKNEEKLEPNTNIKLVNSTSAIAEFKPNVDQQKLFAKELGGKENEGLAGQFVLQYDVERDPRGGEILLQDGYFVHFLAPDQLEPLPKHVVFVLDTSGSMFGSKIQQLKDAMISILNELRDIDSFHIVEFNTGVWVWNIETQESVYTPIEEWKGLLEEVVKTEYPAATPATKEAIEKGKQVIQKLREDGLTNILDSLRTALHLVNLDLKKVKEGGKFKQPIVVFLTDGDPTSGNSNTNDITKIITKINAEKNQVPIFSLSFGDGADKHFLRKLSLNNNGFSRHIYEAGDASLQLQEFYKQISSPLLSNVHFKYTSEVKEVTRRHFPIYFRGCELVSAGKVEGNDIKFIIEGSVLNGTTVLPSVVETPVSSLERLWAYLTIKQKLEERELVDNKTQLTKEALNLALKYSFVTDVSSLVVVKPNDTSDVNTEDASKARVNDYAALHFGVAGAPGMPVPQFYPTLAMKGSPTKIYYHSTPTLNLTYAPPSLSDRLPWLRTALSSQKTLTLKGKLFELGEFETLISSQKCTGTPKNETETGVCSLLKDCPQVFSFLSDFITYEKFSCQLHDKYAGVCCPKSIPIPIGPVP